MIIPVLLVGGLGAGIAVFLGIADRNCTAKYIYSGLPDCDAAARMFAGEKSCEYGCLGLGNCQRI